MGIQKLLTETELELMAILWQLGEGNVHDVIQQLAQDRKLAYTSVSTMLRILEQKDFVATRKEGRGHIYVPKVKKRDYEAKSLQHLVHRVFDGTPSALVRRLIEDGGLTPSDLEMIRHLIDDQSE